MSDAKFKLTFVELVGDERIYVEASANRVLYVYDRLCGDYNLDKFEVYGVFCRLTKGNIPGVYPPLKGCRYQDIDGNIEFPWSNNAKDAFRGASLEIGKRFESGNDVETDNEYDEPPF